MVKSVVGEQRNRRRTRLERFFHYRFALWSDDTDPDSCVYLCYTMLYYVMSMSDLGIPDLLSFIMAL